MPSRFNTMDDLIDELNSLILKRVESKYIKGDWSFEDGNIVFTTSCLIDENDGDLLPESKRLTEFAMKDVLKQLTPLIGAEAYDYLTQDITIIDRNSLLGDFPRDFVFNCQDEEDLLALIEPS